MMNWGRVALGTVLPFMFTTYDGATGASEEGSGLAVTDIEIYKAGGGLTQRSSDTGYALLDADGHALDSIVGLAGFTVDTGDNTDAGFFVAGGYYIVVVSSVTVDAQTVNFIAGTFSLGPTLSVAGVEEVDITHIGGSAVTAASGIPEVKVASMAAGAVTAAAIATGAIDADAIADGAIDAGAIAADAITAAKIAAGAIDAATFAADVDAEILSYLVDDATRIDASQLNTHTAITVAGIADGVWDEDATGHQTGGTFGQAIGDPGADTTTIYQSVVTDAAGTNIAADIIAIEGQTDDIGVAGAGLTALATQASVDAIDDLLDTEVAAIKTVVDAVKVQTDKLTFTVANQVDANALTLDEDEILDDALTDSVPADGALPTVRQALYMIVQFLTERSVSSTTVTVNKVDGSTALMTFTLDSATAPTSITRAT